MEFAILLILTLFNGFFALTEIALVSSKKTKMETLASGWDHRAKIVLDLLKNPEHFLSSVQVGITLIGVIAGAYGGSVITQIITPYLSFLWGYAETASLVLSIGGITYFSIVIGELVPKTLALNNPEKLALICVPILRYFMILTYPFIRFLSLSTALILRVFGISDVNEEKISQEELITLLKNAGKDGVFGKEEWQIHHNVFSFAEQTAKSMITHRNNIEWVDIHDSIPEIFEKIKESTHSKFVIADKSLDNVIWVLKVKDFLEYQNRENFTLHDIITPAIFIPETTTALKILSTFKNKKEYLAVVVDEFGGTEGIITLHDLIEVIVGDLPDEDEETEDLFVRRNDTEHLVSGQALVYEINQYFQDRVIDEAPQEYTSLSGYMLHVFGKLPRVNESFTKKPYIFEIVDMDGIKVDKVLIKKIPETESST